MAGRVNFGAVIGAVGTYDESGAARVASLERILDAALGCFIERGVRATTMADVADAAGVSRVWVHRCAGSKQDLLQAVLIREARNTLNDLARLDLDESSPVDAFARATGLVVARFAAHPLIRRFVSDEADQVVEAFADGSFVSLLAQQITDRAAPAFATTPDALAPVAEAATRVAISLIVAPMTPGGDSAAAVAELMTAAFGPALRQLLGT